MPDLLHLLNSLPTGAKLVGKLQGALKGNPDDLEYIRDHGWQEALELWRPGAGEVGRQVLDRTMESAALIRHVVQGDAAIGDVIEGEFRVVRDPWETFVLRLLKQRYGAHIILGPVGSGKTTLAARLAQRLWRDSGYTVEAVNMYEEDVPDFAVTISVETLVKRMGKLRKYLRNMTVKDDEDDGQDEDEESKRVSLPPTERVVIIDEAILAMGTNAMDPGRQAALQALAQCRHLSWIVIYIGQWAGQLPLQLLGQATVWVKEPSGREALTDRDHPVVRDLWTRAQESFDKLADWEWYQEPWRDRRSWAYVDCQSLNGAKGYTGMVPFLVPDRMREDN